MNEMNCWICRSFVRAHVSVFVNKIYYFIPIFYPANQQKIKAQQQRPEGPYIVKHSLLHSPRTQYTVWWTSLGRVHSFYKVLTLQSVAPSIGVLFYLKIDIPQTCFMFYCLIFVSFVFLCCLFFPLFAHRLSLSPLLFYIH